MPFLELTNDYMELQPQGIKSKYYPRSKEPRRFASTAACLHACHPPSNA